MSQQTDRPFPNVHQADERVLLETLLDWYRDGVIAKTKGLSDAAASMIVTEGSETSLAGLVKHLALVEDSWFCRFLGQPEPEPWASVDFDTDPNWEFRTARSEPLETSVNLYIAAIERSRAIAEQHHLDEVSSLESLDGRPPFTLRYVVVHLLEETARHLGHMDILRERADGLQGP